MKTATIYCTVEGKEREVALEQPRGFDALKLMMSTPPSVLEGDMDEEALPWLEDMVEIVSDLSQEELEKMPGMELNRVIAASVQVFAGQEVDIPSELQREDRDTGGEFEGLFDFDENGYVDTDDWL